MNLLHLSSYPIYEQLKLEEALLRNDTQNWCLINEGSTPAIVMGISGKPAELIHPSNPLPVIKRFSGGGTVIVDEDTLFITFIFQKEAHPFAAYPEPIMRWTEELYKPLFADLPFALRENDYIIGEKKCGGNAQYLRKERWLHHTSFLWNFKQERMDYLLHPKKTPSYRAGRSHEEFLCSLSSFFPSKEAFIERLKEQLALRYSLKEVSLPLMPKGSRQTTCVLVSY